MAATKPPDTLMALMLDVLGRLQYKHAGLLFLIFIVVCIDLFDEHVTSKFSGAIMGGELTGYGLLIKGLLVTILYLSIDALIKLNVI